MIQVNVSGEESKAAVAAEIDNSPDSTRRAIPSNAANRSRRGSEDSTTFTNVSGPGGSA